MTGKNSGDLRDFKADRGKPSAERNRNPGYFEGQPGDGAGSAAWTRVEMDGEAEAIDPLELKEFLETDWTHIQAEPEFKERLRAELWRMVAAMPKGKKDR